MFLLHSSLGAPLLHLENERVSPLPSGEGQQGPLSTPGAGLERAGRESCSTPLLSSPAPCPQDPAWRVEEEEVAPEAGSRAVGPPPAPVQVRWAPAPPEGPWSLVCRLSRPPQPPCGGSSCGSCSGGGVNPVHPSCAPALREPRGHQPVPAELLRWGVGG